MNVDQAIARLQELDLVLSGNANIHERADFFIAIQTVCAELAEARRLLDEANARIERLREDVHYAWSTERECRASLAAIQAACRRVVGRRNAEDGFTVLTVDLEHIESLLAAAPVPAQPARIGLDVAAGIESADYVSPRLRAELGMPPHVAELATNIRRNLSKAQQHVFANSDIEPDGEMLDLLNHMDTLAQQIEGLVPTQPAGDYWLDGNVIRKGSEYVAEIISHDALLLRELLTGKPAQPAVPDGFVLVPIEPTESMLSVAVDNWSGYEEESGRFYTPLDSDVRILWNAMLAASKEPTR